MPTLRFASLLLAILLVLLGVTRPYMGGDILEYATDVVAIASHGTPDIRLDDIARTSQLQPHMANTLGILADDMRAGRPDVYPAFVRGHSGRVYPVHFFGYPLLAAAPYKAFELAGIPPFKGFLVVNYAAVFVLGLALLRFFGSEARAWLGLALFLGCGGAAYLNWTGPECVSAACLLAALLLYVSGAPLAAGLLGGLAGQQNPTIVFFFVFAPLFLVWLGGRAQLTRRHLAGLALGAAVFALPPLFNLVEFGVPNIIAKKFSDRHLVGIVRLVSFYFDLNQGMILGVPGVLLALLLWRRSPHSKRIERATLALCLLFTLALALPALAVLNWNSGAAGIMRYAFWASMPILFALLLRLREEARWPRGWIVGVGLLQAAAMAHAASYSYVKLSPLARTVMAAAPQWYHPEPEIFAERMGQNDNYIRPEQIYAFGSGAARKTLYHAGAEARLCGPGAVLAPGHRIVRSGYDWRYIDGPVRCLAGGRLDQAWLANAFRAEDGLTLDAGWSGIENAGPAWHGVWSDGARSRLVLTLPDWAPASVILRGDYLAGNTRTRVRIDGVDLGWHRLDRPTPIHLPTAPKGGPRRATLTIELEHEAPRSSGPGDTRNIAVFLQEVRLHGPG